MLHRHISERSQLESINKMPGNILKVGQKEINIQDREAIEDITLLEVWALVDRIAFLDEAKKPSDLDVNDPKHNGLSIGNLAEKIPFKEEYIEEMRSKKNLTVDRVWLQEFRAIKSNWNTK